MAGTIIADYIRTDANKLSLNVGNTTFATINAGGFYSNTGTQIIDQNGQINASSIATGTIPTSALANASITRAKMAVPGSVLQTVTTSISSAVSLTTTSMTTIVSASITPTSTSSKIFCIISGMWYKNNTQSGSGSSYWRATRNGTLVPSLYHEQNSSVEKYLFYTDTAINWIVPGTIMFVDSPASTSALTYNWDVRCYNASYGTYIYPGTQMTLMEISG